MAATTEMSATGLLNLEQELVCFICTEVLYQPLTLIDCLHTFCGSCLKEWFSHQHRKATHSRNTTTSNPYTCPTCRATVKDARHMAKIATLLDMFLAANPGRNRSAEEKEEMASRYKRGDDILPPVDTSRRRERRRRDDEELAAREQRMVNEARERSLRDVTSSSFRTGDRLAPGTTHQTSRSRDREERREQRRERERRERERHEELTSGEPSRPTISHRRAEAREPAYQPLPPTSPRHPDAVEARRSRTVAHQSSLRSLVSSSESGTGTGDSLSEARLMQEIQAEGLLDGINVDELTEAEQDELIEIIAERYRQLHPERLPRATSEERPSEREDSADIAAGVQSLQLEEADRNQQGTSRSRQHRPDGTPRTSTSAAAGSTNNRPTTHSSQTGESINTLSPPSTDRARRRRTSDQSGRQEARSSNRTTRPDVTCSPATRSATDLSDSPQTQTAASEDRVRQLSATQRAQTEPRHSPRASELWLQGGVDTRPAQGSAPREVTTAAEVSSTSQMDPSPLGGQATAVPVELPSHPASPVAVAGQMNFAEPSVSCARCSRQEIQYEVHKHCSPCNLDICLRCYRRGRGCDHWFGFGHAALSKFEASQPHSRVSQAMELPHTPVSRQYSKPPNSTLREVINNPNRSQTVPTTSDPSSRLQQGHFCDRCLAFSNACYWTCDYCNDGEWGFCNDCVNSHHCCTHPLLPIAHKLFAPASRQPGYDPHTGTIALTPGDLHASMVRPSTGHSVPSSATSNCDPSMGPQPDYIQLTITTNCDVCMQPIPPADARYHCPAHPSPSPRHLQSIGDYDICTSCYHNQVKAGRIRREDGPAGWRKCPSGHRMIVTAFEADREGSLRRLVLRDLVGGNKVTDEDMSSWKSAMTPAAQSSNGMDPSQSPPMSSRGQWTWREDSTGTRRSTRNRSSTLTSGGSGGKFPPDGGFGKRCVALWTYHPDDGDEGRGELMFPKNAEVKEIEDINEEWSHGVYAGDTGVLPAAYVRELQRS